MVYFPVKFASGGKNNDNDYESANIEWMEMASDDDSNV